MSLGVSRFRADRIWPIFARLEKRLLISRFAHSIEESCGSVAVVIGIALLPVIGYFGMGLVPGMLGLAFGLAFPVCRALNQVIFQDAINTRVPAEMRALFIPFGPMIGQVLDTKGSDQMMNLLGCIYLAGVFVVALPLLMQRRTFQMHS